MCECVRAWLSWLIVSCLEYGIMLAGFLDSILRKAALKLQVQLGSPDAIRLFGNCVPVIRWRGWSDRPQSGLPCFPPSV